MNNLIKTTLIATSLLTQTFGDDTNCYDAKNVYGLYPSHQTICFDCYVHFDDNNNQKQNIKFWNNIEKSIRPMLEDSKKIHTIVQKYGFSIVKDLSDKRKLKIVVQPLGQEDFTINIDGFQTNVFFDGKRTHRKTYIYESEYLTLVDFDKSFREFIDSVKHND